MAPRPTGAIQSLTGASQDSQNLSAPSRVYNGLVTTHGIWAILVIRRPGMP